MLAQLGEQAPPVFAHPLPDQAERRYRVAGERLVVPLQQTTRGRLIDRTHAAALPNPMMITCAHTIYEGYGPPSHGYGAQFYDSLK
ncbi:hypothetical protein ACFQYP_09765 [Nonomuraea antimicrobica]